MVAPAGPSNRKSPKAPQSAELARALQPDARVELPPEVHPDVVVLRLIGTLAPFRRWEHRALHLQLRRLVAQADEQTLLTLTAAVLKRVAQLPPAASRPEARAPARKRVSTGRRRRADDRS